MHLWRKLHIHTPSTYVHTSTLTHRCERINICMIWVIMSTLFLWNTIFHDIKYLNLKNLIHMKLCNCLDFIEKVIALNVNGNYVACNFLSWWNDGCCSERVNSYKFTDDFHLIFAFLFLFVLVLYTWCYMIINAIIVIISIEFRM